MDFMASNSTFVGRATKAQTSMQIPVDWLAPFLFTFLKVHCIIA